MASNPNQKSHELRGSQKLLMDLARNGDVPSLEEIKRALALPASVDLRVPNWLVRGIPPAYLELDATLQVPIGHLSETVNQFVKLNDSAISMRIFINGIPVPDLATVQVSNTPGQV
jgi:hypothetical protein